MSIKEIIDSNPNIQLVVSAADLKEFALELLTGQEKSSIKSDKYLTIAETAEKYGVRIYLIPLIKAWLPPQSKVRWKKFLS